MCIVLGEGKERAEVMDPLLRKTKISYSTNMADWAFLHSCNAILRWRESISFSLLSIQEFYST